VSARRCTTFVCAAVLVAAAVSGNHSAARAEEAVAVAASPSGSATSESTLRAAAGSDAAARRPLLHSSLPERIQVRLRQGLPVALGRLQDHRSCRALFERLGKDGATTLLGTSYYPASDPQESRYCRRSAYAFTEVGGSAVVLCRRFGHLSAGEAAIILLHEALHDAGQTEYPKDPSAPDAAGITKMVMKGCQLF
jgi:hypothetical protein